MILLFYGEQGSGKSLAMHDYVGAQWNQHRFFVVDHEYGWGPDGWHWRGKPPPITIIQGEKNKPKEFPPSGIFVFRSWWPEDVARLAIRLGHTTYVDDELDKTATKDGWKARYPPEQPWLAGNPLRPIVHEGRHLHNEHGEITECHLIGACRRPQNLHTDVSELATEIYVFRCKGENTLGRLLGDGTVTKDELPKIQAQPNLHFHHYPSKQWLQVEPPPASKKVALR